MKRTSLAIAACLGAFAAGHAAADTPRDGQLVSVKARYVFAPVGFDDNDEAVITVDGYLPSGCYRLTRPEVTVDARAKTIVVKPMARFFDVPCIEALVPYHFDVKLGVLPVGEYKITVNDSAPLLETMDVKEASSAGPDDFLYAPIDEVSVAPDPSTGKLFATLKGRFTRGCLAWDEIVVEDNGKTVNLLPIMKMLNDDACSRDETVFKKRVALPDSIRPGRHLLHVRSLNGQAVNLIFVKAAT